MQEIGNQFYLPGSSRNPVLKILRPRSNLSTPAVDEQFNSCDETGIIRSQKQCDLGNFLGLPHASHRNRGNNPRDHVCGLPVRERRVDWTWTNDVRADATVPQICSPGSRERANCSFTRRIDAESGSALKTRDRAVEND